MLPLQFSLRSLLLAVALTAVWCLALINAGPVWVMTTRGISLITLLFAMLAIWYRHGERRAFWAGYLHAGLFYALLAFYAIGGLALRPICSDADIPSGRMAMLVYGWLPEQHRRPDLSSTSTWIDEVTDQINGSTPPARRLRVWLDVQNPRQENPAYIDPAQFRYVFHSGFTLLAGLAGGIVGIWLFRTQGSRE